MKTVFAIAFAAAILVSQSGCGKNAEVGTPVSSSGVKEARVEVQTTDGKTVEQQNVIDRLMMDNKPGSVKHLYVMSAYSGQVLLYSPVRGKVTSSGKRLTPTSVETGIFPEHWNTQRNSYREAGVAVDIANRRYYTQEVLQDDGTYGHSIEYLFWFTPDGRYHQHYLGGGQIVHVADQPIAVKNVVITIESHKP